MSAMLKETLISNHNAAKEDVEVSMPTKRNSDDWARDSEWHKANSDLQARLIRRAHIIAHWVTRFAHAGRRC